MSGGVDLSAEYPGYFNYSSLKNQDIEQQNMFVSKEHEEPYPFWKKTLYDCIHYLCFFIWTFKFFPDHKI